MKALETIAVFCTFVLSDAHSIFAQGVARQNVEFGLVRLQNHGESSVQLKRYPSATERLGAADALRYPVISGDTALLRNGIAYAPSKAPDCVKSAIWAVNTICQKPFLLGGGHRSFSAPGYDCSGAVSFALYHAGVLQAPLVARDFRHYGDAGVGRWMTIFAKREHTYIIIAGLRLDTTDFRYGGRAGPRWHGYLRQGIGFEMRHPAGL